MLYHLVKERRANYLLDKVGSPLSMSKIISKRFTNLKYLHPLPLYDFYAMTS